MNKGGKTKRVIRRVEAGNNYFRRERIHLFSILGVLAVLLFVVVSVGFQGSVFFQPPPVVPEDCSNGMDDDGDTLVDFDDGDCISIDSMEPNIVYNNEAATIEVRGTGIQTGATIILEGYAVTTAQGIDPNGVFLSFDFERVCNPYCVLPVGFLNIQVTNNLANGVNGWSSPASLLLEAPTPTLSVSPNTIQVSGGTVTLSGIGIIPVSGVSPNVINAGTKLWVYTQDPLINPNAAGFIIAQDQNLLSYSNGDLIFNVPPYIAGPYFFRLSNEDASGADIYSNVVPFTVAAGVAPTVCSTSGNTPIVNGFDFIYIDGDGVLTTTTDTFPNTISAPVDIVVRGTFNSANTYSLTFGGISIAPLTLNSLTGNLELMDLPLYGFIPGNNYQLGVVSNNGCPSVSRILIVTGLSPGTMSAAQTSFINDQQRTLTVLASGTLYSSGTWNGGTEVRVGTFDSFDSSYLYPGGWNVVSSNQIDINIPAGTPAGSYDIFLANPGNIVTDNSLDISISTPPSIPGNTGGGSGGSGGGGGGGGGSSGFSWRTIATNVDVSTPQTMTMRAGERATIRVGGISYYVGVRSISSSTNVQMEAGGYGQPQTANMLVGQIGNMDMNRDGSNDVEITLSLIAANRQTATLAIRAIAADFKECQDLIDNDFDSLSDLSDPGCENASDDSENTDSGIVLDLDNDLSSDEQGSAAESIRIILWIVIIALVLGIVVIGFMIIRTYMKRPRSLPYDGKNAYSNLVSSAKSDTDEYYIR